MITEPPPTTLERKINFVCFHCYLRFSVIGRPKIVVYSLSNSSYFSALASVICWSVFSSTLKILFIFYWRIIALQDGVGFCHTSTQISHGYTCVLLLCHPCHFPVHSAHLFRHRVPHLLETRAYREKGLHSSPALPLRHPQHCSSCLPLSYLVWKLRRRICTLKAFFYPVS